MKPRFIQGLFICLVCMIATPAQAAVVYTYAGNPFDTFSSPSSYDASMLVTVTLELASKLGPNLNGVDVAPVSFNLDDGIQIINDSNATDASFNFSTDATGAITFWFVRAQIGFPTDPPTVNDTSSSINTGKDSFSANDFGGTVTCLDVNCTTSANDFGEVINNAGAWSVVPLPPAFYLFGSGLLGLIGIVRRKAAA